MSRLNKLQVTPGLAQRSALLGGLIWLSLFALSIGDSPETALIQRIVLLGILVVVPLALSLVPNRRTAGFDRDFYRWALIAQPIGAIAAVASFLVERGWIAGALAGLWFGVTALIALLGLARLRGHDINDAAEISIDGGLIYLPVAGVWLVVSRLGIQLLGFGDTIILLTAVHFTFAAYAAPILAGLAGRRLSELGTGDAVFKFVPLGILLGTPLVAAGITFSPIAALIGTLMIALGLMLLAILVIGWLLPKVDSVAARLLLSISSFSSGTAIILACVYAYSIVVRKLLIDIPQMAMTHGLVNAFGFVLCGLIAWSIIESSNPKER